MRRRFFSNRFDYMILYTSIDGNVVHPHTIVGFNQNIKSNTYTNIGKITFRGPFSIGPSVFHNCGTLKTIIIPNGITSIGNQAFSYCDNLTSVTIPDSVTEIGSSTFEECISLTSITIPDSVTSIRDYAFDGCASLTSAVIGNSVTSIGDDAFFNCKSLTSIEIPNSVTSIGYSAFKNCSSLTAVYIKAITPPTLDYYVFYENASGRKIYVPRASLNAYKTASGWKDYASAIEPYDY